MISNRGYGQPNVQIQHLKDEIKALKQNNVALESRVAELEEEVTAIQAPNVIGARIPHKGSIR